MFHRLNALPRHPVLLRLSTAMALGTVATTAQAHDGHGLFGPHWHATDAFGFVGLALAIAAAIWFSRGGK